MEHFHTPTVTGAVHATAHPQPVPAIGVCTDAQCITVKNLLRPAGSGSDTRVELHNLENCTDLQVTDRDDSLALMSYNECTNDSSERLKSCRGIVVDRKTGRVLWMSNGYVDQYVDECPMTDADLAGYSAYVALGGTCLRLFYHNNRWVLCTHRKLDAFDSRWGSDTSFGKLFVDALMANYALQYDVFLSDLNKEHMYSFFLHTSPGGPDESELYIVSTHDKHGVVTDSDIGVTEQPKLAVAITADALLAFVRNIDSKHQGVILRKEGSRDVKIVNAEYHAAVSRKQKETALAWEYLRVRSDCGAYKPFVDRNVESNKVFVYIEHRIQTAARRLVKEYTSRYGDDKYHYLQATEHFLLKRVRHKMRRHGDTENDDVLYRNFLFLLSDMSPCSLAAIIKMEQCEFSAAQ